MDKLISLLNSTTIDEDKLENEEIDSLYDHTGPTGEYNFDILYDGSTGGVGATGIIGPIGEYNFDLFPKQVEYGGATGPTGNYEYHWGATGMMGPTCDPYY